MNLAEQPRLNEHPTGIQSGQASQLKGDSDPANLVDCLRHGDRWAAEQLVDQFYQRLYAYIRELGHSQHVSEDLTQEVFLRAWSHIGQLRNDKALNAWLYRIASNVSCEHWRKHVRREKADEKGMQQHAKQHDVMALSDQFGRSEEFENLLESVRHLSWKLRQAVVLHYLQGFSIAEAAEVACIKTGTFKSRLNRALESLRQSLGETRGSEEE
ncbi:RNA polymerase sigma factor [Planctomycetota bacterium]